MVHHKVVKYSEQRSVFLSFVYGVNEVTARRELWETIVSLAPAMDDENWLFFGDFNELLD